MSLESLNDLRPFWYPFGSLGQMVSPLGLGTVKIGRNSKVKNSSPDGFRLPDQKEVSDLLALALDLGINLIDTAPAYGESEERLGKCLPGKRDKIFISSKVGEEFDGEKSNYDFSAASIRKSVERSLQRLRVDYLDCVLLHCPRDDYDIMAYSDALSVLSDLKSRGLVRSFGASTNSVEGGLYAAEHTDCVMVSYNICYRNEISVIERALELDRAVLIKKALLQGFVNKVEKQGDPITQCMDSIFSLSRNISAVVGTLSAKHLQNNVAAAVSVLSLI
ncbi:MAG: aldo/keto reductase [Bdellovibrionota bacterium]